MEGALHLGGTTPEVENLVRIVAVGELGRMNEVAELGVLRVIGMPEKAYSVSARRESGRG
jgi:hypothetical protein